MQPKKILDLGCGNGALTHALLQDGYNIMGCDADLEGIEIAKKRGGNFIVKSVYDDPSSLGNDFHTVISAEVIEHLYSPKSLPQFAHTVLQDFGYLVITTPYHGYLKNLALSLADKWDFHHTPLWEGGHIKFWSKNTLFQLLRETGFTVKEFHGVGRVPYLWKSMIVVARKTPGDRSR